jgi:2-methylisocitrate lyase-like PEP mutase family enzyme
MKKFTVLAAISTFALASASPAITSAAGNPVPCEKMLKDVKAAIKSAKLSDADNAKVMDLQGQGLERCKADDDSGADAIFAQALKILGK